jgi:AraC family transcriptional regulator
LAALYAAKKRNSEGSGEILYFVQSFSESDGFVGFTPETVFEKWAAEEVASRNSVPDEMQLFVLGGGHFAVFGHCGPPGEFPKTLNFIVSQ